jgi:hypothetical protein
MYAIMPFHSNCCRLRPAADAELRKVWELLEEKYRTPAAK